MKEAYQDEGKSSPIKIIVPIIIIAIIVIAVIIFSAQQVPNNDDISLNTNDQNFGFAGSLVTNGELTDSFGSNNAPLIVTTNSSRSRIVINSRGVDQSVLFGTPRITVRNAQGIVIGTLSASSIQTNLEGEIIIDLDLAELSDLNIDWDGDTPTGDIARELELEIVFDNELSGEVLTVEIPLQLQFREFLGTGCLRLSRQSITQTTHNGVLEISGRINNICSQAELKTRVSWRSDYMGSVEISLGNKSITLTPEEQIISENFVSVQDFEIIYMPNKNAQGKRANFSVDFGLENSVESILFDVVNENLEQCLIVTTEDDEISDWDDTATISFDASKCKSDISVFVCDNDYGCSGGAEGAISISQGHFSLSEYSPTKTISISRGEIPGVYGVTIDARVKGTEKTFISEKEIFVTHSVADTLKDLLIKYGAYELTVDQGKVLVKEIFKEIRPGRTPSVINMDYIGKPPNVILKRAIGLDIPPETKIVILETDKEHPLIWTEQIMPVLPFVRCKNDKEAMDEGVAAEQGLRHTIVFHSNNLQNMAYMSSIADASQFVKNASSLGGLGIEGEGFKSLVISTGGEGLAHPRMFTSIRRCVMNDDFRYRFGQEQTG